jgi:hypothetical protein
VAAAAVKRGEVNPSDGVRPKDSGFIDDTASKTGKSRDTIKRAKSRGAVKAFTFIFKSLKINGF